MARNHVGLEGHLGEFNAGTVHIPKEYQGREQTWIKHRVLQEYLIIWASKLASVSRQGRPVQLWYVDTFAGPWQSRDENLQDTSIAIGLKAIQGALAFWQNQKLPVGMGAIFIEKDAEKFNELKTFLAAQKLPFQPHAFHGTFGGNVEMIERVIADDPAFCFVDPTGWKGADMKYIKRLVSKPRRDVLINFMYDYVNRFKDHREGTQHQEMESFFGAEIPANLSEEDTLRFYRQQLATTCGLQYAADLIVQDPCRDRTKFRLVVGGNHVDVLKLFRTVEKKVIHRDQPLIRLVAKEQRDHERTGQLSLLAPTDCLADSETEKEFLKIGEDQVLNLLPSLFKKIGKATFETYYPELLQECHITFTSLKKLMWRLHADKKITLDGLESRQKTIKDKNVIVAVKDDLRKAEEQPQLSFNLD